MVSGFNNQALAYESRNICSSHAAWFMAVELYDGKTKVAEDRHAGSSGHKQSNNVYTLNVSKVVKKPRLYVTFDMETNRDSYGRITVTKK